MAKKDDVKGKVIGAKGAKRRGAKAEKQLKGGRKSKAVKEKPKAIKGKKVIADFPEYASQNMVKQVKLAVNKKTLTEMFVGKYFEVSGQVLEISKVKSVTVDAVSNSPFEIHLGFELAVLNTDTGQKGVMYYFVNEEIGDDVDTEEFETFDADDAAEDGDNVEGDEPSDKMPDTAAETMPTKDEGEEDDDDEDEDDEDEDDEDEDDEDEDDEDEDDEDEEEDVNKGDDKRRTEL